LIFTQVTRDDKAAGVVASRPSGVNIDGVQADVPYCSVRIRASGMQNA
jgi:hypothetical protein